MKKMLALLLLAGLMISFACPALAQEAAPALWMHPGETMAAPQAQGWESTDESVAVVDGQGNITAVSSGACQILCATAQGTVAYDLTVDENVPTELLKKAIAAAQQEYEALDGKAIKKANKYTKWYAKKDGVSFGWCGAFVGWCFEEAGIPMSRVEKAEKVDDNATWAISEASVGKILKGYDKMGRLSDIPRPGYMVIYSVTKKSYYNIHTGLVTDVQDLGEGQYLITTIEGNVSNRVKKYQYYYDSTPEAMKKQRNMSELPKDMRTDEKMSYVLHAKDWYIKTFCQTYQ